MRERPGWRYLDWMGDLVHPWVLHVDLDQFIAAVEVLRRPELARLVGGGRDDGPFGGVAAAPDDHRPAHELGTPQHLDRREELVEVHVQDPGTHAVSVPHRARRVDG